MSSLLHSAVQLGARLRDSGRVLFTHDEVSRLFALQARGVAGGHWSDYALADGPDQAVFEMRGPRLSGTPTEGAPSVSVAAIVKRMVGTHQIEWRLLDRGEVVARDRDLDRVLELLMSRAGLGPLASAGSAAGSTGGGAATAAAGQRAGG